MAITIYGVISQKAFLPTRLSKLPEKDRGEVIALCLARALEWFWTNYGPLRFNAGYAVRELGYTSTKKTKAIKQAAAKSYPDAILPNVRSGNTRTDVKTAFRVETKVLDKAGTASGTIKLSLPGYITSTSTKTGAILASITAAEGERICDRFFAEVIRVSGSFSMEPTKGRDGVVRARASAGTADSAMLGSRSRQSYVAMRQSAAQEARNG